MTITSTYTTTAGTAHTVELTIGECRILASAPLAPWLTRPARDCVESSTWRNDPTGERVVLRMERVTAAELTQLAECIAA